MREQEIKIENKDVYIIEVLTYEDDQYIYVQEIENDELVDKYMVYKYDQERNAMIHIKDEKKLEELLKMFVEKIQADI